MSGTSTTAAQKNPWRYTGGYQDPTDGYYKLGARYYDAAGHFTQADSIGGSLARPEKYNSYTYTAGDPANSTDLSGASPENPYACAASAALAAYAVYTFVSYVALGATGDALSAGTATPLVVLGGVGLGYATIASLALVPDACRS